MGSNLGSTSPPGSGRGWRPRGPATAAATSALASGQSGLAGTQPAGLRLRFPAFLIDFVIPQIVVGGAVEEASRRWALAAAAAFVVVLVGNAWFWSRRGRSPGMLAFRMRVVTVGGTLLSAPRATLRALLLELSIALLLVPALVSAFMVGLGRQKQGIHDLAAGSVVVRV